MAISAPSFDQGLILEKCKNHLDFQLWPIEMEAQIEPWLANFLPDEKEHAYHLLNSFLFFSERMTKQLFLSAVNDLSVRIRKPGRTMSGERSAWRSLFDSILVTQVTGEAPNPTDSGNLFSRYARDFLGFDEAQILSNDEVLRVLLSNNPRPVIFVDDFAGSGNQFARMWKRKHQIGSLHMSFAMYASKQRGGFFGYCPALCTQYGAENIAKECPEVIVSPGNLLTPQYSAIAPDSIIWPDHLRQNASEFLRKASARAGIPEAGGSEDDWRGFHKLGLCIAFHHGMPDASLPLFKWQQNGWAPLVRYS
ncbi:phosphoribosyltransferase-like protein [Bradyrhizobium uaiense]|uniref:PRTase-CE domain-containing protein n=1 Tax=Bradyrhizobium uaiense TaxID=2594946 RepID=A0A6P1BAL5_9BRAD|nr:hypothetical protein [Bradyrhizobium uaiense]NEU95234.1 hypothetical protein [Bradyrhizobium uaiense]